MLATSTTSTTADERAFPFRFPEEREHFELVELMAMDSMRLFVGLQPQATYARSWWVFAKTEGPSRTNAYPGCPPAFDPERMRHEARRGRREWADTRLTT